MRSYLKGVFSEYLAIFILFCQGYTIIKRRYKTKVGEIDIIAVKGKYLVAFEVKARHNGEKTTDFVSNKQLRRINNALKVFLAKNEQYSNYYITIDIILFLSYFKYNRFKQVQIYE